MPGNEKYQMRKGTMAAALGSLEAMGKAALARSSESPKL